MLLDTIQGFRPEFLVDGFLTGRLQVLLDEIL